MAKAKGDATPAKAKKKRKPRQSAHQTRKAKERAENMKMALYLRTQGHSYSNIAEMMGSPQSTVHKWVQDAIRDIPAEEATLVRAMEVERLDRIMSKLMGQFDEDDLPNTLLVGPILQVMDRKMKMLGLAPQPDDPASQLMQSMGSRLAEMVAADKPVLRPDGPVPAHPVL